MSQHDGPDKIEFGKINQLTVLEIQSFGVFFDGGSLGKILLPKRQVTRQYQPGDVETIFIYRDSEDRLLASAKMPKAVVGEFAWLKVAMLSNVGAFLDWGLPKDLLVPFREQKQRMVEGKHYLVYIYFDEESDRLAATSRINRHLDLSPANYPEGQEVDLLISNRTSLGYKAIVNNAHWGILYANEVFQPLTAGQRSKGYIKKVRKDGKLDLSLYPPVGQQIDHLSVKILEQLQAGAGFLPINDKSAPEVIYDRFGVSKKAFKKSIGALYKKRLITISAEGIRLTENASE